MRSYTLWERGLREAKWRCQTSGRRTAGSHRTVDKPARARVGATADQPLSHLPPPALPPTRAGARAGVVVLM